MPYITKHKTFSIAFLLFFISGVIENLCAEEVFYHLRFDVSTVDGRVTGSELNMIPGKSDFRADNFSNITARGVAVLSANESPVVDMESRAKHDCLKQILTRSGLKSVHSKQTSRNNIQTDEIIMSYEGVVKKPFKIITKGGTKDRATYYVEMEVNFSPIAFPDRWSDLEMEKKVQDTWDNILFIFR